MLKDSPKSIQLTQSSEILYDPNLPYQMTPDFIPLIDFFYICYLLKSKSLKHNVQ